MYKITGKQMFGAVWAKDECVVMFDHGEAYTNDTTKADILRSLGYNVMGEPDQLDPTEDETSSESVTLAADVPTEDENLTMGVNPPKATRRTRKADSE